MADRYGRVKFTTIQATKNELRRAIQEEGTPRIQDIWDKLEQWIDSPPMSAGVTSDNTIKLESQDGSFLSTE